MTSNVPISVPSSPEQIGAPPSVPPSHPLPPSSPSSASAGNSKYARTSEAKLEEKYLDLEEKVAIERDYYSGELILERNRSDTELKAAQKAAQDKLIFARTENVKLKEEIKGLKAAKKA